MRRFIISFISIIILYALQCTLFASALSVAGITPNLILMFTCIVGYMRGRASGIFTGFFSGLLVDIMAGKIIGFTALLYMLAGFLNGIFHKEYVKEQLIFPEIEYDKIDKVRGMDIIFVTTANTDEEARELLTLFNMPFAK